MMKLNGKILASVFVIASVMFGLGFGTMAYFSDVEQVPGASTLTAATINIDVDDSTIFKHYMDDLKPCQTAYLVFEITNVGVNPVDVYKHLYEFATVEGTPWDIYSDPGFVDKLNEDLDGYILYDLSVEIKLVGDHVWWQMIYDEDISMHAVECEWIYLGMLPAGCTMVVTQSYHMEADVGNWAQGDKMTFSVEVRGDQLQGVRLLENKRESDWKILQGDGIKGTLTYGVRGPTFKGSFDGKGLKQSTDYDLIYYPDPWPGTGLKVLGSGTSLADGTISFTFDTDCGDLPVASDPNFPGAKVWLVLSGDHDGTKMNAWNQADYLFETGLIEYNKIP